MSKYLVLIHGEIEVEAESVFDAINLAMHKLPDDGYRTHLTLTAAPVDSEEWVGR